MPDIYERWHGTYDAWQSPAFGEIYARATGRRRVMVNGLQLFVSRRPLAGNVTLYLYAPSSQGEWLDDVLRLARRLRVARLCVYSPTPVPSLERHLVAEPTTLLVDLRQGADSLWSAVGSKTRNMVRRAEKHGVVVTSSVDDSEIGQWLTIYGDLADSAGFGAQSEDLVRSLLSRPDLAQLFVCQHGGRVVGGCLFLTRRYPMYWLGAVDRRHADLAVGHITLWRAIVDFAGRGFPLMDLGGIDPSEEGSTRFKKSFSREVAGGYSYDVRVAAWKKAALAPFLRRIK